MRTRISYYEKAQICKNGHPITAYCIGSPERKQEFCDKCGQSTITQCEHCGADIRGKYMVEGVVDISKYASPNYCHKCGSPYPWTIKKIDAFRELTDELDELSPEEKSKLKLSLDDLICSSPKTQLAEARFKKILSKVSRESYEIIRGVLTDIVSETVKKSLFK